MVKYPKTEIKHNTICQLLDFFAIGCGSLPLRQEGKKGKHWDVCQMSSAYFTPFSSNLPLSPQTKQSGIKTLGIVGNYIDSFLNPEPK